MGDCGDHYPYETRDCCGGYYCEECDKLASEDPEYGQVSWTCEDCERIYCNKDNCLRQIVKDHHERTWGGYGSCCSEKASLLLREMGKLPTNCCGKLLKEGTWACSGCERLYCANEECLELTESYKVPNPMKCCSKSAYFYCPDL